MISTMTKKLSAAFCEVAATIAVMTSSSGRSGIDNTTSVMRMMMKSTQLP